MRARGAAERGPRRRRCCCSRRAARTRRREIRIPAMFPIMFKSSLDWDLLGEPEPGLGGRRLYLPRGRMIGGSSSINAMIYLRGHRADFDGWAAAGARAGRTTRCCRTSSAPRTTSAARTSSTASAGRSSVSDSRSMHPFVDAMLEAAAQAGLRADRRPQRRPARGRRRASSSRSAAACAAARPTRSSTRRRPGRTSRCASGVFVERIVFEGDRAVGVEIVATAARDDPGRARGDRLRRRLPVARAADAVRDRPRGGPRRSSGSPVRENLPVGREPPGPLHGQRQLPHRRAGAVRHLHARRTSRCSRGGPRAADLELPGGGRLLPHAPACPRPTSSSTSRPRPSSTRA